MSEVEAKITSRRRKPTELFAVHVRNIPVGASRRLVASPVLKCCPIPLAFEPCLKPGITRTPNCSTPNQSSKQALASSPLPGKLAASPLGKRRLRVALHDPTKRLTQTVGVFQLRVTVG